MEGIRNMAVCYQPCAPFTDFCNAYNANDPKCRQCAADHQLSDFIE